MKKILALAVVAAASAVSINAMAGNVATGKELAKKYNCAACHGEDYNKAIDPAYPKLAGQHKDYLAIAMLAYKRGAKGPNGRNNAIMAAQVKPLSNQDIEDISEYLASLPGSLVQKR